MMSTDKPTVKRPRGTYFRKELALLILVIGGYYAHLGLVGLAGGALGPAGRYLALGGFLIAGGTGLWGWCQRRIVFSVAATVLGAGTLIMVVAVGHRGSAFLVRGLILGAAVLAVGIVLILSRVTKPAVGGQK